MSRIGVMICGHGSRDDAACVEFSRVVDQIAHRLPEWPVAMGYLEFARPIIREGLDAHKDWEKKFYAQAEQMRSQTQS